MEGQCHMAGQCRMQGGSEKSHIEGGRVTCTRAGQCHMPNITSSNVDRVEHDRRLFYSFSTEQQLGTAARKFCYGPDLSSRAADVAASSPPVLPQRSQPRSFPQPLRQMWPPVRPPCCPNAHTPAHFHSLSGRKSCTPHPTPPPCPPSPFP
eukprot:360641-Chlamydomonas_euryale.AAC.1